MSSAISESWSVAGHAEAIASFSTSIRTGRIAHAYAITGPEGVGRTTLALAFARALNCETRSDGTFCGVCESCRRIQREGEHHSHPDVTLADLEWQATLFGGSKSDRSRARQRLSIEAVRYLRQDILTRPVLSKWKIQIIDDADRLSAGAPDAFLKTLEEPPSYAVIILIATSLESLPQTIRSRCRQITLGVVGRSDIIMKLQEAGVAPDVASQLAIRSRGRLAYALNLANDTDAQRAQREAIEEAFEQVIDPLARLNISGPIAARHTSHRDETFERLELYLGIWRDAILLRNSLDDRVAFPEISDRLAAYVRDFDLSSLNRAIWATRRCIEDLDNNFQSRIALHAMVMQWP